MSSLVHRWDQIVRWYDVMSSRYQPWFLPGFLILLAVIGLVLLYSELRQAGRDKKKWKAQPRPLNFPKQERRLKAG